jgi:hypothetical protein
MRYFRLQILGDESDRERIIVDQPPEDLDGWDFCMVQGKRIGERYPADAKVQLRDEYPGIKLTDFISNTVCHLIVSTRMMTAIKEHERNAEVEYLPLAIYNHRKRLHSDQYWIVNPIGATDCLDLQKSDVMRGNETGEITFVEAYVFLEQRLQPDPPSILRVKETPWEYFVDESTARAFHAMRASNVQVDMVPCTP